MANQITPNPSVPSQVVAEVKFPKFINNLGIIPTSYKDSMSYYECLAWLCKFLEEQVIPTVNENGKAVEELQSLYVELNSYVTNYFDNLDVQEEINNKLDEMVEDGTLQEIIADYLNSKAIFGFNSVQEMKEATNLINGSYAKTTGYYLPNDGGSALYYISKTEPNSYYETLESGLYAKLIYENSQINIKQLGAKGDGVSDDSSIFTSAFNLMNSTYMNLFIPNGIYVITTDLPKLFKGFSIIGVENENSNSNIGSIIYDKRINSSAYLIESDSTIANFNGGILSNIHFKCDYESTNLLYGVKTNNAWDSIIEKCTFQNYEIGLFLSGDDCKINECFFISCGTKETSNSYNYGVTIQSANEKRFTNCHFEHSRFFLKITSSCWSNSFLGCKFETGTVYSNINSSLPTINLTSSYSDYPTTFTNCDFHALDIEYYIEIVGMISYADAPYILYSNNDSPAIIEGCSFMSGPGSGSTQYKQYSQSKFINGNYIQINNSIFIGASYMITSIDVSNLLWNNNKIIVKADGSYTAGSYSEDVPIVSTTYGKCTNTSFGIRRSTINKYYRIFNKNFDFTTTTNNTFSRSSQIYNSKIYVVIKTHRSTFAFPFKLNVSNLLSGNMYGSFDGNLVSWNGSVGGALKRNGISHGSSATAIAYFKGNDVAIELNGLNASQGAYTFLEFLQDLPFDWYLTTSYDISDPLYTTSLFD